VLLDRSGKRLAGPSDEGSPLFAPLSGGYVVVDDEEFEGEERRLVARSLDATLSRPSAPSGLSFDRRAHGNQLLSTPDGKRVLFLYTEEDKLYGAPLECSSEPGPLERPTCPEMDRLTPLDPGCREEVCHVIVRLDASTLGVKAHALREGSLEPVDIDEAEDIAVSFLEEHDVDVFDDPSMTGPNAGTFMAFVEPSDFGSFVLVGQDSGQVVTAGEVVYAGRGYYWEPNEWLPASDLQCGAKPARPAHSAFGETSDCEGVADASEALDTALRSNLAAYLAEQGEFSAFTLLYTPTVGGCDPGVAEYLIVLTQAAE
jgi:hypothetical protein